MFTSYNVGSWAGQTCITPASIQGSYSNSLSLAAINEYLVRTGVLLGSDIMTMILLTYNGAGAGRYNLSVGWDMGSTIQLTNPGEVVLSGFTVANTYFAQNLSSLDFCNLSYPSPSLTVVSTQVDFLFQDRAGLNVRKVITQGYPRLYIGYANGIWYTPSGLYGLPLAANNFTLPLLVNFSYTEVTTGAADKAACIGILLRNDYQPLPGTFTNASVNPMMQIEVCLWWSSTLPRNGKLSTVTDGANTYELLSQTITSFNQLSSWNTYIFVTTNNTLSNVNLNVLAFSQFIHSSVTPLTNYYITGIYFGFRIYTGRGSFTYSSVPQLALTNVATGSLSVVPPSSLPSRNNSQMEVSCSISTYNTSTSQCQLSSSGWLLYDIILQVVSTPNAVILLRLSPLMLVADEFSYYAYHQSHYDANFQFLADLCWDFNNEKWVPSPVEPAYNSISGVLDDWSIADWAARTPARFRRLN